MDAPVPGDGSSSPSADPAVVGIEKKGPRSGLYIITLTDGASFFCSEELLRAERLCPGTSRSAVEWEALVHRAEEGLCYAGGLRLLARAEQPGQRVRLKLLQRGFSDRAIRAALGRLKEEGLLDDRRFAALWAEERARRKAEGPSLVLAGLLKRGVDRATAGEVLGELDARGVFDEALERSRERQSRDNPEPWQLRQRLQALGFESWRLKDR